MNIQVFNYLKYIFFSYNEIITPINTETLYQVICLIWKTHKKERRRGSSVVNSSHLRSERCRTASQRSNHPSSQETLCGTNYCSIHVYSSVLSKGTSVLHPKPIPENSERKTTNPVYLKINPQVPTN